MENMSDLPEDKKGVRLFIVIQNLEFDYRKIPFTGSFSDYVNGFVLSLRERSIRVKKFSLKCKMGLDQDKIDKSICRILNCGVVDLELSINGKLGYTLPSQLFTSKTVVSLKLGEDLVITDLPQKACLPSLENLTLESVRFSAVRDCAFKTLISASPVLKELNIDGMYWEFWNWSGRISSPSLQRLYICRSLSDGYDNPEYQSITFDTPNLVYLEIADFVPDEYPSVNFNSLIEAKLGLQLLINHEWKAYTADDDLISSNPTNLIQGLRNLHVLELSSPLMFETLYFFRDAIPVFDNLHHLTMVHDIDMGVCWRFLPFLIKKTPNLKTLIIEGGLHYTEDPELPEYVCKCMSGYSFLLSCPVEVLEISLCEISVAGIKGELKQVEHFIGKLSHLLLLKVHFWSSISVREVLTVTTHLQGLPRASSRCKIEFLPVTQE